MSWILVWVFTLLSSYADLTAQCVHFFDDEGLFLASVPNPDMESFEGLPVTNNFQANTQFVLSGFTMDLDGTGGVYNVPTAGMYPTHGNNYINYQGGQVLPDDLVFTFNSPKNAFGLNIVDWGDFGVGSLTFMNNAGDSYTVDVSPNPNGNDQFFGVINYDFAFTMAVFSQTIRGEAYGIDEVYCDFINLPSTSAMACKNINVSLNEDCEVPVVPAMVLSGFYPCYDPFIVELSYHNHPISNPISLDYLGKRVTAAVIDTVTGNKCWSEILVEDKFAPEVLCLDDTVNCIEYKRFYEDPGVIEHCLSYTLTKVDEYVESLSCNERYIKRVRQRWIATDEFGNVSDTCGRTLMIERFPLDDVVCPRRSITLYCDDNYRRDANGNPHPDVSGAPTIDGLSLYPQPDFFCNLWVDYTDVDLGKIGCTRKIMRVWHVEEWWCTEDLDVPCTQFIYIEDRTGPELIVPFDSLYATTNVGYHTCEGDVWIPIPDAYDQCHDNIEFDLRYTGGFFNNWKGEKITLPEGFHTVYITAFDSCYNATNDSVVVHVQDKIAPIAVCDQNTVIALDNDGIVHAYAEVFDDGSFDDCYLHDMQVRRMDDPCLSGTDVWGDYVEFCCDDVDNEVMVGFRVMDKSGNYGTCMVNVLVVDKLPPTVIGPPDITVDCRFDYDPNHLDVFGRMVFDEADRRPIVIDSDSVRFGGPAIDGIAYDNCPMVMVDSQDRSFIDNCGNGELRRFFKGIDAQGLRTIYHLQRITFVNSDPFDESNIIWPEDIDTINVCGSLFFNPTFLPEHQAEPRFVYDDECSLVGATYKDHVIDQTGGAEACFKILRKWKVIDWCQFENNEFRKWEHEQVILVENNRPPTIVTRECQDTVFCFQTAGCTPPPFTLSARALDDCTPRDQLYWLAKFDFNNDGSFDTIRTGSNVVTDVFPVGIHRIKWFVEDLCGNETTCEHIFEIRNCKAPLAYCKTGVILELVPMDLDGDGTPDAEMVELWASDLDDGSKAECHDNVVFSFSADTTDRGRMYNCDSIGVRRVTIWVTDRITGASSRCITMVTIQDNNNVDICDDNANGNIVGNVQMNDKQNVVNVMVSLGGSGMPDDQTGTDGNYAFMNMSLGGDYEVVPYKDNDVLNGVTTADIVKIQRYLLGKENLVGPYQHLAADVNMSGSITASDISDLRKVILGNKATFSSNKSWRFIDRDYVFQNVDDPLAESIPSTKTIRPFMSDETVNWTGVKLGDVNGNADPSGANNINAPREGYALLVEEGFRQRGEVVDIAIEASALQDLDACQFTLEVPDHLADIVEIVPVNDAINYSHFNLTMKYLGMVTFSWDNPHNDKVDVLFNVRLRLKEDAFISELVGLTNTVTPSLMSLNGDERPVTVDFVDKNVSDVAAMLYQNSPNPWSDRTIIKFSLPAQQKATVTIMDANGRLIWEATEIFQKGVNVVDLFRSNLAGVSGVLYYQLKTEDFIQTRKMLLL